MDVHSSIQAMASHLNTQEGPLECGLASGRVRVRSHLWDDDIVIDLGPKDTVLEAKKKIQDKTGVSPDKIHLSLSENTLANDLVLASYIKPGQDLICSSALRGGSLESLHPDGVYDCFCNYGERCGGIFMWRFMLLPAYIDCPRDCAFFCFRFQCCLDSGGGGTTPDGKPKIKKVEATSNTGVFY